MTRSELEASVQAARGEIKAALELVLAELNPGQRKKLLKNSTVKALLERHGVEVDA